MNNLHVQKLELEHAKRAFCTQLRTLRTVSHRPLEMPRLLHDIKGTCKSKTSFAYLKDINVDNNNVKKVI